MQPVPSLHQLHNTSSHVQHVLGGGGGIAVVGRMFSWLKVDFVGANECKFPDSRGWITIGTFRLCFLWKENISHLHDIKNACAKVLPLHTYKRVMFVDEMSSHLCRFSLQTRLGDAMGRWDAFQSRNRSPEIFGSQIVKKQFDNVSLCICYFFLGETT